MYAIMKKDKEFNPSSIIVYVEIAYYKNCGFNMDEKMISRLGTAKDEAGVKKLIAQDCKTMGNTYGGLIEATSNKGRSYLAFRCGGWEKIKA